MTLRDSKRPKWYDYVCLQGEKIVDRDLLTRRQHEELLATPRPAFGPPPAPPRGRKTTCKYPKIWPPRIDQLALPTVKAMEGVLEHFNQTLEPMRIVRLVQLIHTKETERPTHSTKPGKKKAVPKKKRKKTKKKECLEVWLKKQSKKSAKLIVNAVRERKAATPDYRQLLVAISLMKAMKIKKKKQLPRYTKQYLMKICEQLAIICDTEWAPYKRVPETPEAVPLEPVESVVSRRHIFWRMRPFEEEEEEGVESSVESVEEEEEEVAEGVYVKREPKEEMVSKEEVVPKEERVSIKEEVRSMSDIGEESTYEEYKDYERELEKELEGFGVGKEAEGAADFGADEEGEKQVEKEEGEEEKEGDEENIQGGVALDDGEGEEGQQEEAEAEGHAEEENLDEEGEEEDEGEVSRGEGEEAVTTEEITDEIEGGVKSEGGKSLPEEGEPDTVAPEDSDFEPLTEEEEEGEIEKEVIEAEIDDQIIKEEKEGEEEEGEEEEGEEEEGEEERSEEEKLEKKLKKEMPKKKEKAKERQKQEKGKPTIEDKVEGEVESEEEESEEESEVEGEVEAKVEAPPAEIVEKHPPNTVSYLSWNIYSHWLEEYGRNIQTYGKCLHNFKTILEAGTDVQVDKISTILANWSTYLNESRMFEKNMSKYFKGKKMTKCAKCGDYTLYNIPKDHEIPGELKEAAKSTGRWKKLLEEAEELCRSFSAVAEDTISLVSHESIDVTESYAASTSETSMYVVEDYYPSRR